MSYLSSGLQTACKLDLVDTMMHRLAIGSTLWHGAFTTSTAHTDTVNDVALHEREKRDLELGIFIACSNRRLTHSRKLTGVEMGILNTLTYA